MFETEINKLKEKKIEHCANLQWLLQLIKQVIIKTRINVSQGKPTDLRLNWPRFWTNVTKDRKAGHLRLSEELWTLRTCPIC